MPAKLDEVMEVGPEDPCQCASKFYSLVLEPNRPRSKHDRTNRMGRLIADIICPPVKISPPVNIKID
jgi:hypothetical protein